MKVIIAGTRTIQDMSLVERAITSSGFNITEEVCGEAEGVDALGKAWARAHDIPVKSFPAHWGLFGKSAGRIRNGQMAEYADALIAVTSGSPGTKNMIEIAQSLELHVYVLSVQR